MIPLMPCAAVAAAVMYLTAELLFFLYFTYHLIPAANERTAPQPYRDYPAVTDRHKLLIRIMTRLEMIARQRRNTNNEQEQLRNVVSNYLYQCFYYLAEDEDAEAEAEAEATTATAETDSSSNTSSSSLDGSEGVSASAALLEGSGNLSEDEEEEEQEDRDGDTNNEREAAAPTRRYSQWTVPGLVKENVDEFFAWAFFGKHFADLLPSEQRELAFCYTEIERQLGLTFTEAADSPAGCRNVPRKMSLEDVNPMHRPLTVYLAVTFLKWVAGIFLRCVGFQRVVSGSTGLVGWYRPATASAKKGTTAPSRGSGDDNKNNKDDRLHPPLLFFHGIAPGGLVFYLPMVLNLVSDGRDVFMFENPSISCAVQFKVLSERETCHGVEEIVNRCLGDPTGPVSLCGHSFGSCPLTWLLHHRRRRRRDSDRDNAERDRRDRYESSSCFRSRIRQLVLINPITILLTEPDVMTNFLYSSQKTSNVIRMLAATELFTEYSIRRHFAWYNSELWFDDVPDHVSVLVALSGSDEIVNSPKVKRYMELYRGAAASKGVPGTAQQQQERNDSSGSSSSNMRLLYWEGAGHAECVTNPDKWLLIRQAMLKQELEMYQQRRLLQ